jgi:hypothetical protein
MKYKRGRKEMTGPSAATVESSVAAEQQAEIANSLKSRARKPKRYIAPEKGRDWYEKAGGKIAIRQNATRTPRGRT